MPLNWTATLDADDALAGIEHAVNMRGHGFRYSDEFEYGSVGCSYFVNEAPACIVAVAVDFLNGDASKVFLSPSDGSIREVVENTSQFQDAGITVTPEATDIFAAAQTVQDADMAWGAALAAAYRVRLNQLRDKAETALYDEPPF